MKVGFVIENLEKISDWVLLEYSHSRKLSGKSNLTISGSGKVSGFNTEKRHAWELALPDPIVLDPNAKETLEPEDFSEGENFLVLGGICGDFPPKARTAPLVTKKFPKGTRVRSLGSLQLPTDIALWTALEISKGRKLSEIPFFPQGEFKLSEYESVKINLGYPSVKGKPLHTPGLLELLRKREKF